MASTSGGKVSVILREAALEPQQLYHVHTQTPQMTDVNGNVVSWYHNWFLGVLHVKQLVVEGRGYNRNNLPSLTGSSSTKGWAITQSGEIVANGTFEEKSISIEASRHNEAGMWRVRKTVTIKALYENGKKVDGLESFAEGDYTI